MSQILRISLSILIIVIHTLAMYYFYSAHWVTYSNLMIAWVSLIIVGITMSLLFYLGLVIKIPTKSKYFDFDKFENEAKIYEKLGVNIFKYILLRSPFFFLNKELKLKSKIHIVGLEREMRIVEIGHLIGAIIVFIVIPIMISRDWLFLLWLMIFNVLLHIYPIFLQRYNRLRIKNIMDQYV